MYVGHMTRIPAINACTTRAWKNELLLFTTLFKRMPDIIYYTEVRQLQVVQVRIATAL